MFQKELVLIKQVCHKNVCFEIIGFLDVRFKFEYQVCNGCHYLFTIAYGLGNIAILRAKGSTFRCILWGISRDEGLRRLNNSVLEDKGVL